MSRLKETWDLVRKQKMVKEGKATRLEKGDFTALLIASFSVFGPVLIGCLIFFGLLIWLIVLLFQ